jgi:hypothetical protein
MTTYYLTTKHQKLSSTSRGQINLLQQVPCLTNLKEMINLSQKASRFKYTRNTSLTEIQKIAMYVFQQTKNHSFYNQRLKETKFHCTLISTRIKLNLMIMLKSISETVPKKVLQAQDEVEF